MLRTIAVLTFFVGQSIGQESIISVPPGPGPLDNPLKGWCPYTDAGEIHQPYSMVFQYVSWCDLEPNEGDFQFEEWEKTWDASANGKHVIFRVYIDYPSKPSGLPDWLRKQGVKETKYTDYGGGYAPDYNDPKMISAMERLIAAMGERYDQHPRVAFIQLGLLGFWGEWHTYPKNHLYASASTEERIIKAYRKAFPNKSLMVRYARDYAATLNWIGFHDDMFPEDTDNGENWSFLSGLRLSGRDLNWRRAVIGGEMVPNKAKQWMNQDFESTMTMLERAHFTWVGPYCPALEDDVDPDFASRSEQLIRKMGYQFQIQRVKLDRSVATGETLAFSIEGINQGVAPFYYPWSIKVAWIDPDGTIVATENTNWDLRRWQPGRFSESARLPASVPPGKYSIAIGIIDPWKNRPSVSFANDVPVIEGWTILADIDVTAR